MSLDNMPKAGLPTWLYVIGWLFLLWVFVSILSFRPDTNTNIVLTGMYFINFGVHEVSHIITAFLPPIFTAAAGSFGETLFTVLLIFASVKGKSYFAAAFSGMWCMLALRSVSVYMSDARTQTLPLIGPGETVQHDWHYVFDQLGWLQYDTTIGSFVYALGILIGVISLAFGMFVIVGSVLNANGQKFSRPSALN